MPENRNVYSYTAKLPGAIYVWLVPSEEELDQPGSWRIRKWDIEPFPEANFTLRPDRFDGPSRDQTIEECAKVCDKLGASGYAPTDRLIGWEIAAEKIRALKQSSATVDTK